VLLFFLCQPCDSVRFDDSPTSTCPSSPPRLNRPRYQRLCSAAAPVNMQKIGGRYYDEGALRKTLHASIALEHRVGPLLCVNPIVPFKRSLHAPVKLVRGGLLSVLS
jgi:hypothetical protein